MSSFNSFEKYKHFDRDKFFSYWQNSVFGIEDFDKLEGVKKRSETDKLRNRIKDLWLSFNENREDFKRKYSDTKKFIKAYLSSFYLPNIQRIYSILIQKSNLKELLYSYENSGDSFTILDFGAGPMSASVALLLVLDYAGINLNGKKIRIITVERSSQMISSGLELLKAGFVNGPDISHDNFSSAVKVTEKCDFILCANVFNEIPEKYRILNMETLMSLSKGYLLITEPGQDVHSRALSSLRNQLIENSKFSINVIAPCLHSGKCPLSTESERSDWCWFNTPWMVPEHAAIVDKITGLDHRQLNYSYLFLKTEKTHSEENHYRVISDIISPVRKNNRNKLEIWMRNSIIEGNAGCLLRISDRNVSKLLLCGSNGVLCSFVGEKESFSNLKRGSIITSLPNNSCLCKER